VGSSGWHWKDVFRLRRIYVCNLTLRAVLYCHVSGVCVTNKTGLEFCDRIYWTFIQLVTTVHKSLTHCHLLPTGHSTGTVLTSNELSVQSQSYVTTDGQSASVSWNKASIWGLQPDFYYCQTVAALLMCGALSDERTGLSFTISAGPRQRGHSQARVPWDSLPYFTVSDSRLPFSLPPTTRRATVEVFDPASTRDKIRINYVSPPL
jgi:hypothetical protein